MYKSKTILALILARKGSKRLPNKNISLLCDKPLIAWTIEAAKKSKYIDRIVVSTDSVEIAKRSKSYSAEVPFLRPKELAVDFASSCDTLLHALNWLEKNENKKYDYFIHLQITSPLRNNRHIDEAIEKLVSNQKTDALFSVLKWGKQPSSICVINKQNFLEFPFRPKEKFRSKQEFYLNNGAIFIAKTKIFLDKKTFYLKKLDYYLMDETHSIDIDTKYDFELAEYFLKK